MTIYCVKVKGLICNLEACSTFPCDELGLFPRGRVGKQVEVAPVNSPNLDKNPPVGAKQGAGNGITRVRGQKRNRGESGQAS